MVSVYEKGANGGRGGWHWGARRSVCSILDRYYKETGMNQTDFAEEAGVREDTLSKARRHQDGKVDRFFGSADHPIVLACIMSLLMRRGIVKNDGEVEERLSEWPKDFISTKGVGWVVKEAKRLVKERGYTWPLEEIDTIKEAPSAQAMSVQIIVRTSDEIIQTLDILTPHDRQVTSQREEISQILLQLVRKLRNNPDTSLDE